MQMHKKKRSYSDHMRKPKTQTKTRVADFRQGEANKVSETRNVRSFAVSG